MKLLNLIKNGAPNRGLLSMIQIKLGTKGGNSK